MRFRDSRENRPRTWRAGLMTWGRRLGDHGTATESIHNRSRADRPFRVHFDTMKQELGSAGCSGI